MMKNFMFQTKIQFLRMFGRNKRFLLVSVFVPIFFYLLFTKLISVGLTGEALTLWKADYLVSMMTYELLMQAIMTLASALANDRENGFDKFITLSPLTKGRYYLSIVLNFFFLFELSIVSLLIVGYYANDVRYSVGEMGSFLIALPLTSIPVILLGILVSLTGSSNTVSGVSNLVVFPLAIVSGLWWPIDILPSWIQSIGKWMPTYFMTDVMKTLYHRHELATSSVLALMGWMVVLLFCLGGILYTKRRKGYQLL